MILIGFNRIYSGDFVFSSFNDIQETLCTDNDECTDETDNCNTNDDCANTDGGFTCAC